MLKNPVITIKQPNIHKKETKTKEEKKHVFSSDKYKEFKDNYKFKDPNFVPFRLENPRLSRSKSPPLSNQQTKRSPKKVFEHDSKPKFSNRDFLNYKTTTDFFSNLYCENKKLFKTFTEKLNPKEELLKDPIPLAFNAWSLKNPKKEDSQTDFELYSVKILNKIKKISLISSILGDNCYEIIYLLENEQKFDTLIKEYIKDMKFNEFLDIQQTIMQRLMKIFREVIVDKVLSKEGEALKEVGDFLAVRLDRVLETFKEYFNKYQELFSNMRVLQENELKIENGLYEGLYFIIDYYNLYSHENHLFGKAKPTMEAYIYSIKTFKKELNKDSRNGKASKLYEDLELVLKGLFEKVVQLKDELKNKELENKKLSELYEEKIKKNKDEQMVGLYEKRKESMIINE